MNRSQAFASVVVNDRYGAQTSHGFRNRNQTITNGQSMLKTQYDSGIGLGQYLEFDKGTDYKKV